MEAAEKEVQDFSTAPIFAGTLAKVVAVQSFCLLSFESQHGDSKLSLIGTICLFGLIPQKDLRLKSLCIVFFHSDLFLDIPWA